eukprot:13447631-Heterocapsa_arctica.AAC.2
MVGRTFTSGERSPLERKMARQQSKVCSMVKDTLRGKNGEGTNKGITSVGKPQGDISVVANTVAAPLYNISSPPLPLIGSNRS